MPMPPLMTHISVSFSRLNLSIKTQVKGKYYLNIKNNKKILNRIIEGEL